MTQDSTRCLILTRHAESGWQDAEGDDHARTLTARGRDEARRTGRWLARAGLVPDATLVSSARRTRETWEVIAAELPAPGAATIHDSLYQAGPDLMLRVLQKAQGRTVMMIGHNPGIGALAQVIVSRAPAHPQFDTYPPCATLVAGFTQSDWTGLRFGSGTTSAFVLPGELGADGDED